MLCDSPQSPGRRTQREEREKLKQTPLECGAGPGAPSHNPEIRPKLTPRVSAQPTVPPQVPQNCLFFWPKWLHGRLWGDPFSFSKSTFVWDYSWLIALGWPGVFIELLLSQHHDSWLQTLLCNVLMISSPCLISGYPLLYLKSSIWVYLLRKNVGLIRLSVHTFSPLPLFPNVDCIFIVTIQNFSTSGPALYFQCEHPLENQDGNIDYPHNLNVVDRSVALLGVIRPQSRVPPQCHIPEAAKGNSLGSLMWFSTWLSTLDSLLQR